MAMTPLVNPVTSTGVKLSILTPLPSWPFELLPQHLTPPALVNAQAWLAPVASAMTPLLSPLTGVGVWRSVFVPSPISPWSFNPQQETPPAVVIAQVNWPLFLSVAPAPIELTEGVLAVFPSTLNVTEPVGAPLPLP